MEAWKPGQRISWRHHRRDGRVVRREGTVWALAPTEPEELEAAWVSPEQRMPGDGYRLLLVARSQDRGPSSSDDPGSATGARVVAARRAAIEARRARSVDPNR